MVSSIRLEKPHSLSYHAITFIRLPCTRVWFASNTDNACGEGALKVKDIEEGSSPQLPKTWPNLPIFIDSPGFDFSMERSEVLVRVPLSSVGFSNDFSFDGVTAGLKVNQQVHAPLLCVIDVFDVASGDLSLPGKSQ